VTFVAVDTAIVHVTYLLTYPGDGLIKGKLVGQ